MSDIHLDLTFNKIIETKTLYFRKVVKKKMRGAAFKYLVSKIKSKREKK